MKLIIDIPYNEYKNIKEYYEKNDTVEATYSYIYHGTPLTDLSFRCIDSIDGKFVLEADKAEGDEK